jgi:hypothetical protein
MQLLAQILILGPKVRKYDKENFKKLRKYLEEKAGSGGVMSNIGNAIKSKVMESHSEVDWSNFMPHILDKTQNHHNI